MKKIFSLVLVFFMVMVLGSCVDRGEIPGGEEIQTDKTQLYI